MALRAGYFGLKRFEKNKLSVLAASMPADISPDNPIAGKNDVLTSIGLLNDTVGWISKNKMLPDIKHLTTMGSALGETTLSSTDDAVAYVAALDANTDYVVSAKGGNRFRVALANVEPANNSTVYIVYNGTGTNNKYAFNSGDYSYIYLLADFQGTGTTETIKPMLATKEQYDLDSSYEPYHESVNDMLAVKTGSIVDSTGVTQYAPWSFTFKMGNLVLFQYRFTVGSENISAAETVIGDLGIKPIKNDNIYQFIDCFGETSPVLLAVNNQGKVVLVSSFTLLAGKTYVGSGMFMINPTTAANREVTAEPEVKEPIKKATKKKVIKEEEE